MIVIATNSFQSVILSADRTECPRGEGKRRI